MGRSKMSSLKMTLLPLAVYLLLSLLSQVSGKPSPRHLLVETKNKSKAKKSSDYVDDITNSGVVGSIHDLSVNHDYVNNINNAPGGGIGAVVDKSFNDYVENINNGGTVGVVVDKSFNDYVANINNNGKVGLIKDASRNIGKGSDYVNNIKNAGKVGLIKDASRNIGKGSDYVNNIKNAGKVGLIKDASANFRG